MKPPLPTITVVTPSFNQAKYLETTIASVLMQREDIHEYFIYDGGSTDGSRDIIETHAGQLDFWTSEKDEGQSHAIQKGFARATGEVLLWLNSDDVLLPGAIRRVREAFAENTHWDVLTGWSIFLDQNNMITRVNHVPYESRGWAQRGVLHVCQQTCYFRRSLYERVGGIDVNLHCSMDIDLWLKFFDTNACWGHLPALLGGFRQHETMKGRTWEKRYEEERNIIAARYPWYPTRGNRYSPSAWTYRLIRLIGFLSSAQRNDRRLVGRHLSDLLA
jgi:glycosyltransferase involved in cell wall biosynthesis